MVSNFGKTILDRMGLGQTSHDIMHLEHIDGKGSLTYRINEHIKVMMGDVQLEEVPDASGKTLTVKLTNGSNDISDTLTFTQGADTAGTIKTFNMDKTYWELKPGASLVITTAGDTVTLGECIVRLFCKRMN